MFNDTNISHGICDKWTGLFADYHARLHLHYLEVSYAQLLQQNRNLIHPVPEAVINRLLDKLDIPDYSEAHDVQRTSLTATDTHPFTRTAWRAQ